MKYEIESKSDFLTGSYLVVKIPENELDQNALHTIQKECPDFILPFHYKCTNGYMEITYKIGSKSKLQYFSGDFTPKEYSNLWQSLLTPLFECTDWFMDPCSFVLCTDYLYYDKNMKTVSYVYIPSICGCSEVDAFNEMAVKVSKMMKVSDAVLENKVLRSIIENFNPIDFLKMVKDHVSECVELPETPDAAGSHDEQHDQKEHAESDEIYSGSEKDRPLRPMSDPLEDIQIDLKPHIENEQNNKDREPGGYKIFSSRSKRKKSIQPEKVIQIHDTALEKGIPRIEVKQGSKSNPVQSVKKQAEIIDITQSTIIMPDGPGLRYVGRAHMPQAIQIVIAEGEIFTIGRFDSTIGKKQSSFEFDKKTKAVSRRHAVIERDGEGYKIIDLSSSAGTYVNDKKLPPNTPYGLETGCRVSFGNSGADYVWEVS